MHAVTDPAQLGRAVTRASSFKHLTLDGMPWVHIGPAMICDGDGLFADTVRQCLNLGPPHQQDGSAGLRGSGIPPHTAEQVFRSKQVIIEYTGERCTAANGRVSLYVFKPRSGMCIDGSGSTAGKIKCVWL